MQIDYRIGDCLEVLKEFPENHFDACVTDPPYGLEFMGRNWDKLWDKRDDSEGRIGRWQGSDGVDRTPGAPGYAGLLRTGAPSKYLAGVEAYRWHLGWAAEVFRVLKPGAHLLAFGGARTYHRLTCALEDAGFEIRDCLMWLYAVGFPKSLDVSKTIDKHLGARRTVVGVNPNIAGRSRRSNPIYATASVTGPATPEAAKWSGWGTALKPAVEPIVMARKPLQGTVAENVLKYGTGGINVDECRVETLPEKPWGRVHPTRGKYPGWEVDRNLVPAHESNWTHEEPEPNPIGRWPANVILSHTLDCERVGTKRVRSTPAHPVRSTIDQYDGYGSITRKSGEIVNYGDASGTESVEDWRCVPSCPVRMLDEQSGELHGAGNIRIAREAKGTSMFGIGEFDHNPNYHENLGGGASRFFYVAKASREEREIGLGPPLSCFRCERAERDGKDGHEGEHMYNDHPTVKPLAFMRYLVRLITPPEGLILDPFLGTGTTLLAARLEGFSALGIEKEPEYEPIIKGRLSALPPALESFGADSPPS